MTMPNAMAATEEPGRRGPILSLRGVTKAYGAVQALSDVDLDVEPGQVHALIGPNGAGKSTALSIAGGQARPSAGTVQLLGADVTTKSPWHRASLGLGRTFQHPAVFHDMTVRENVEAAARAGGHPTGLARLRSRVSANSSGPVARDLLIATGLVDHENEPAQRLSHGQRRLVEVCMALCTASTILLVDEPTAGVAHGNALRLLTTVTDLARRRGVAVLLVEHNLEFVSAVADRVTVLEGGRVLITGSPDDVLSSQRVRRAYLGDAT